MKLKIIVIYVTLCLALLIPLGAAAQQATQAQESQEASEVKVYAPGAAAPQASVPQAAMNMVSEMNGQLAGELGDMINGLGVIITTPVNLNNLEQTSPLGRQLAEEMAYQLMRYGYRVQEIRKGSGLIFDPQQGEFLLTRDPEMLDATAAEAPVVVVGTYSITPRSVRVNMRFIHTPSNEVLAMSSATIPLNREVRAMTSDLAMERWGRIPSVSTRLSSEYGPAAAVENNPRSFLPTRN